MSEARLVTDAAVEVKGRVVRSHMEGDVRVIDELRIESASFVPYLKDDEHVFVYAAAPAEGLEDSTVWKALCDLLDEVLPLLDEPYPYRKREERLDERMRWFGRAESIARAALARHESETK